MLRRVQDQAALLQRRRVDQAQMEVLERVDLVGEVPEDEQVGVVEEELFPVRPATELSE